MGQTREVSQTDPAPEVLEEAVRVLAEGGVLVMPTDSVYGIGCAMLPHNPGHERIFEIKRRERTQTLPLLVADPEDLTRLGREVSLPAQTLTDSYWPGALTLVVHAAESVPGEYRASDGTVALRCPDSTLVRELARRVGVPLAVTSANTHGVEAATSGAGLEARIVSEADLVLDAGPAPVGVPSTIVDGTSGELRILRQGAIELCDELKR